MNNCSGTAHAMLATTSFRAETPTQIIYTSDRYCYNNLHHALASIAVGFCRGLSWVLAASFDSNLSELYIIGFLNVVCSLLWYKIYLRRFGPQVKKIVAG